MLIIGGGGFIGRNLVNALCDLNLRVKVLNLGPNIFPASSNVEYIEGSFMDDETLSYALEGVTTVFHLVSTTTPSSSNLDPAFDIKTNLIGLIKLLDLMRKKSISKIIFLSSGGTVYGEPQYTPIDIKHPLKPICSYGVIKVAMENYLNMYSHLYEIRPTILRVSNPYGPGQPTQGGQGVIANFMDKIKSGESIDVWGDGSSVRDYIYIDDLVSLCVKASFSNVFGVFNVGSGKGHSVNEVISSIESVTGSKAQINYKASRLLDVKKVFLDVKVTERTFSWTSSFNLLDGVKKYHDQLILDGLKN